MRRRSYLATFGAGVASLTGCLGVPTNRGATRSESTRTPQPSPTAEPTATTASRRLPMGRSVTVDGSELRVANPSLEKAILAPGVHDPTVRTTAGQFVVVDVRRDGEPLDRGTEAVLRSSVDGEPPRESEPVPSAEPGRWGFPFPAVESERAAVRWRTDGGDIYWNLPTTVRTTLDAKPSFRVTSATVPRRDGRLVLDLTVVNDGTRDGRFRAVVSMEAFSGREVIEFPVPAGESRRYTGRAGKLLLYFENNGGGTLAVRYPTDGSMARIERTVELSGSNSTSTARP